MSKEAYYFSHDANARQDPKILALMSVYGAEGYGWYWIVVEMLREQSDFTLDMQGKYSFNAIAMQMHCNKDTAEKFVHDCINEFELFESDGQRFWSNSLLRRMALKEEISMKRKKAAEKRWAKKQNDTDDMQMHSTSNTDGMQGKEKKEKKGKEIKESATSKIQFADTVFLTQQEYDRLIDDFGKGNVNNYIERLDEWQSNNPRKKKKDHNKTLRVWMKDVKKPVIQNYNEYQEDRNVVSQVSGSLF